MKLSGSSPRNVGRVRRRQSVFVHKTCVELETRLGIVGDCCMHFDSQRLFGFCLESSKRHSEGVRTVFVSVGPYRAMKLFAKYSLGTNWVLIIIFAVDVGSAGLASTPSRPARRCGSPGLSPGSLHVPRVGQVIRGRHVMRGCTCESKCVWKVDKSVQQSRKNTASPSLS